MKSALNVHWKDCCWSWNSNTLVTWCEELTHLKRPRCWERLKVGGEGDDRGEMVGWHHWFGGRVWVSSRSWWWRGKPGVLQSIGSQRVRDDWVTELNWYQLYLNKTGDGGGRGKIAMAMEINVGCPQNSTDRHVSFSNYSGSHYSHPFSGPYRELNIYQWQTCFI